MKLRIDDLDVESFPTMSDGKAVRGTVNAMEGTDGCVLVHMPWSEYALVEPGAAFRLLGKAQVVGSDVESRFRVGASPAVQARG